MKSRNFRLEELIPKEVFEKYGEKAWWFLNPDMIKLADRIKDQFPKGSMIINNWFWGGDRNWSGFRTLYYDGYSPYSQHSLGNAFDAIFTDYNVNEVRNYILNNPDEFPELRGIELGISWLHCDTRNTDKLVKFYP